MPAKQKPGKNWHVFVPNLPTAAAAVPLGPLIQWSWLWISRCSNCILNFFHYDPFGSPFLREFFHAIRGSSHLILLLHRGHWLAPGVGRGCSWLSPRDAGAQVLEDSTLPAPGCDDLHRSGLWETLPGHRIGTFLPTPCHGPCQTIAPKTIPHPSHVARVLILEILGLSIETRDDFCNWFGPCMYSNCPDSLP